MINVGAKPLVYNVYCSDTIAYLKMERRVDGRNIQTKIDRARTGEARLKHYVTDNAGTEVCAVTIKSAKYLNIYWGDGSVDYDVCGDSSTAQTIAHTYAAVGEYYPVITGCIDEIVSFDTTSIIVWDKL